MLKKIAELFLLLSFWFVALVVLLVGILWIADALAEPSNIPQPVKASWYGVGDGFHGRRTASGEVFNAHGLTAAHKTLRFGTNLRVTNVRTGKSVVVRINDRGPYAHGRGIDLSYGAAKAIGLTGVGYVVMEAL
jgi:rare lipoprotein A